MYNIYVLTVCVYGGMKSTDGRLFKQMRVYKIRLRLISSSYACVKSRIRVKYMRLRFYKTHGFVCVLTGALTNMTSKKKNSRIHIF